MIDYFSLGLTHGLMILIAWRLVARPDLDIEVSDTPESTPRSWPKDRQD
jgi:hypothetical protein